jgi:hypothetical protein
MQRSVLWLALSMGFVICAASAGDLPDPRLTPGRADPSLTRDELCAPGFSTKTIRRHGSRASGDEIYRTYGVTRNDPPCPCEIDHLIPLGIGGSSDRGNLWPQSYSAVPWNSKRKDELETQLRTEVCSGKIELLAAQHEIATDWIAAYQKRFGQPSSKRRKASASLLPTP